MVACGSGERLQQAHRLRTQADAAKCLRLYDIQVSFASLQVENPRTLHAGEHCSTSRQLWTRRGVASCEKERNDVKEVTCVGFQRLAVERPAFEDQI
mmetsp:Transcript_37699/g.124887  ORF Transcript_37699/g.124887 Transcript_37699/m.124887 type:complete len:97 (+) Transcript_37699:1743-2033(+)